MIIKSLKINQFGKINNKEINLNNKINIIYGKNESGKTTILKFIESTFYGANKNKNKREISDFDQYEPWNENDFSGKINYELDSGNSFEVFRDFHKKNPKVYNENLEEITKQFNIDKNRGSEFFKEQTGMDEELFYSTVFMEQERIKLDEREQNILLQKMTNLISSGSESISYRKTMDKLKCKLLEEVGTDRTTEKPINKTDEELTFYKKKYTELENLTTRQANFNENENSIKNEIDLNEKYINAIREIKKQKEDEKIEQEIINIKQKEINELEEKLNNKKNEEKNTNEKNNLKNKKIYFFTIILFLLVITTIILFLINKIKLINYLFLFFTSIYLLYFIFKIINKNKIFKKIKEEEIKNKKEQEILEENIKNKKEELNNKLNNFKSNIYEKNKIIKNKFNEINLDDLFLKNLNEIKNELEKYEEKNNSLKMKLHEIQIERKNIISETEKMPEIEEKINSLQEEKNELIFLAKAINLTKETLEESYDEMKKSLTPQFTKELSEMIDSISNGKYQNILFNDTDGLMVEVENGDYKKAERLSTGTIFQMYLSLRLAIAQEITNEKMPIFLDEAFAYYDDERLENILVFLSKEYNDRQIIIFTCSNREKKILDENNIEYNLIEI